jgi:hypothetical protein
MPARALTLVRLSSRFIWMKAKSSLFVNNYFKNDKFTGLDPYFRPIPTCSRSTTCCIPAASGYSSRIFLPSSRAFSP